MAFTHCVLTLTGSAQALSTATGAPAESIRTVTIQPGTANANPVFIGKSTVSTTDYGARLPAAVSNEPPAPIMIGDTQGQLGHFKMSDVYVRGTNTEKVHLLVVTI